MYRILVKERFMRHTMTIQRKFLGFWIPDLFGVTVEVTGLDPDVTKYVTKALKFYGEDTEIVVK